VTESSLKAYVEEEPISHLFLVFFFLLSVIGGCVYRVLHYRVACCREAARHAGFFLYFSFLSCVCGCVCFRCYGWRL
jgi:hypothetical protein